MGCKPELLKGIFVISMSMINKIFVRETVIPRPDDAHKGSMGTLLSICGSYSMAGACILSGKAALRSGVGLLRCVVPTSIYPIVASQIYESVFLPVEETGKGAVSKNAAAEILNAADKSNAVIIGCGSGNNEDTKAVVSALITENEKPLLIDADGINAIVGNIDILKKSVCPIILTPHPGEMSRLIGKNIDFVQNNREQVAADFADKYNVTVVLKGNGTIVASGDNKLCKNITGNSGMATGGSGDVLAGIIGAFMAKGIDIFESGCCGVYVHGLAGDISSSKKTKTAMLPTDIIDNLCEAFRQIENA